MSKERITWTGESQSQTHFRYSTVLGYFQQSAPSQDTDGKDVDHVLCTLCDHDSGIPYKTYQLIQRLQIIGAKQLWTNRSTLRHRRRVRSDGVQAAMGAVPALGSSAECAGVSGKFADNVQGSVSGKARSGRAQRCGGVLRD